MDSKKFLSLIAVIFTLGCGAGSSAVAMTCQECNEKFKACNGDHLCEAQYFTCRESCPPLRGTEPAILNEEPREIQ